MDIKDLGYDINDQYTEERVVSIVEKKDAHLYDQVDCAIFKFKLSTSTNPPWREEFDEAIKQNQNIDEHLDPYPFQESHSNKRIHIHGSEIDLTCKPTEIEFLLSAVKAAMVTANDKYELYRQEQLKISAQNKAAKEQEVASRKEKEEKFQEMFEGLDI